MLAGPAPSRVPARRGARRLCCGGGRAPPAPQRPFCVQMVDAGGCPAGEGWRRMEAAPDGAVDIVPLDRYDSARAKIAANLQWICAKAYGIGGSGRGRGGGSRGRRWGRGRGRLCARGPGPHGAARGPLRSRPAAGRGARWRGRGRGSPGRCGRRRRVRGRRSVAALGWVRGRPSCGGGVRGQTLDALRWRGAQKLARGTARRETGVETECAARAPSPRWAPVANNWVTLLPHPLPSVLMCLAD